VADLPPSNPFKYSGPIRRGKPPVSSSKKTIGIILGATLHIGAIGILIWLVFGREKPAPEPEARHEVAVTKDTHRTSPPRPTPEPARVTPPPKAVDPPKIKSTDLPLELPPAGLVSLNLSPPNPPLPPLAGGPLPAKVAPLVREFENKHTGSVRALALLPKGDFLLSGGDDRRIHAWNTATAKEIKTLDGTPHVICSLAVDCRGIAAASGSDDGKVHFWDLGQGREAFALSGHKGKVHGLAFSPNGQYVLSGGADGSARLWDINLRESVREIKTGQPATSVAFGADGRRAIVGGDHGTVTVLDLEAAKPVHTLGGHIGTVTGVAISPDGHQAVSVGDDKTMRFWDVVAGKKITIAGPLGTGSFSHIRFTQSLRAVAYAGDGSWVAAAGANSSVTVATLDGRCRVTLDTPPRGGALALAVAPGGEAVYLATDQAAVRRMDLQGGPDFYSTGSKPGSAEQPPPGKAGR
jgi:WD40 repeat protein